MYRITWLVFILYVAIRLEPSASDPAPPTPKLTRTDQIDPEQLAMSDGMAKIQGLNMDQPPTGTPRWTKDTCQANCNSQYGSAVFPAKGNLPAATIPVSRAEVVHSGNVCNCPPTEEIIARLTAENRDLNTFYTFHNKGPTFSNSWFDRNQIKITKPKGKSKGMFGGIFKKGSGSGSSG